MTLKLKRATSHTITIVTNTIMHPKSHNDLSPSKNQKEAYKLESKENYLQSDYLDLHNTESSETNISVSYLFAKRFLDIILSFVGIILLSPLLLVIAVIVKMTSKGPVLFVQERIGLKGQEFKIYKFRSMRIDAEKDGPVWAQKDDDRVTDTGKVLRKYRFDELPQLFNILRGDMSFVGPRPERDYFYNKFEEYIPDFRDRTAVKPGLTGFAQVNGGYDITPKEKLVYDKCYIKNVSLLLDFKIVLKTIKVVFKGEGSR